MAAFKELPAEYIAHYNCLDSRLLRTILTCKSRVPRSLLFPNISGFVGSIDFLFEVEPFLTPRGDAWMQSVSLEAWNVFRSGEPKKFDTRNSNRINCKFTFVSHFVADSIIRMYSTEQRTFSCVLHMMSLWNCFVLMGSIIMPGWSVLPSQKLAVILLRMWFEHICVVDNRN